MKIAVSSTGPSIASPADERLGRCNCFLVFDETENLLEVINNEAVNSNQGAGIKSVQLLLNNKVDVVLTGRVGPKALNAVKAGGLAVYTGIYGNVKDSLKGYLNGEMQPLFLPDSAEKAFAGAQDQVET